MNQPTQDQALRLLEGAYDLHVHTALDYRPRSVDDLELLRQADAYHMAGVLIKNHYEPTQARAYLANRHAQVNAVAYGSITLNSTVGGLNPYAVENALRQGAKMVWMPTMDSVLCAQLNLGQHFKRRRGVSIYGREGKICREVYEILDLVKQYDVYIASGHLGAEETLDFCRLALAQGAKVVMTHPDWPRSPIPVELQAELAGAGALIEKVFWYLPPAQLCGSIRQIGAQHAFVVTDRGQADQESPARCMLRYVREMLSYGLTEQEIRSLIRLVPQKIVGAQALSPRAEKGG